MNNYFQRSEFACKCGCGLDTVDYELLTILTDVREYFGEPVVITSGCRCDLHNHTVGGATKSQHTTGKAADFYVRDVEADVVADYLESKYPDSLGIGRYSNRTHVDTRGWRSRWSND